MKFLKSSIFIGVVIWLVLAIGGALCFTYAGSTKQATTITINQNWVRADAQKEFYSYQFPTMYNKMLGDLDTLYVHAPAAPHGDSTQTKHPLVGGATGTVLDTIRMSDGTHDTLCITVGAKTWKFLPVSDQ